MPRTTLTLTAAGLTYVVADVLKPDRGLHAAERYAGVAAHPALEGLSSVLFLVTGALFVLGAAFAYDARGTGRGAAAVGVGALLTSVTGLWLTLTYAGFGLTFLQAVQQLPRSATYTLVAGTAAGWGHVPDLLLLGQVVGPVVLALGLWRAGRTGWPVAVLWLVGILGFGATEFWFVPGQVAGLLAATAALYLIGRGVDAGRPVAVPVPEPALA